MNDDVCHVACAVVGDHLPHAAAMLLSLVDHGREPAVAVHLLHDEGVRASDRSLLGEMLAGLGVGLQCHEIPDDRLHGLPTAGFTGKGSWYRVFLPELLPDVDRVLYLDVDLLVLDAITPLREVELEGMYVAAVTNVFEDAHLHRPAELGLSGPDRYFNAGVLLMNLAEMRRNGCTAALLEYGVANAPKLLWRDQDALNVVLGDRRVELEPRWNCMNSIMEFPRAVDVFGAEAVQEARRNPAIRHFEGPSLSKPWHYLGDPAMQGAYAVLRQRTPWPAVELEDRTLATGLIRRLPAHRRRAAYVRLLKVRRRLGPSARNRTRMR